MRIRSTAVCVTLIAGLGVGLAGCSKLNEVRAMKAFKDGNRLYRGSDWKAAAEKYEETVRLDPNANVDTCGTGNPGCVYFYLANSYDNLYRPTRKGEPQNDEYLQKAIDNYRLASEKIEEARMKQLSLQYLVATLRNPDKLNDPTQAEPILQQMIKLDPNDPTNYFELGRLYEDSGEYELAEQTFLKAREVKPNDPAVHMQLAGYYNRQGNFDKTIAAVQDRVKIEPNNPEAHYTLANYFWDEAYRDFRLSDAQKMDYVRQGIDAVDKAIAIKADYMEALVYKNLLLRLQANLEKDPAKQQALLREADQLRDKATALQKKKAAGASD